MQGYKRVVLELPDRKEVIAVVCLLRRVLIINQSANTGANLVLIKTNI